MVWLKQIILAVLEWLTGLSREDKKASDADKIPEELKNKWRERIMEVERKSKNETTSQTLSGSGD
jgi:fructoselysine-6-P-deglycase FrlB-like protein